MIASLLHNICPRVMANLSENDNLLQNLQEIDQRERKEEGREKRRKEEGRKGGRKNERNGRYWIKCIELSTSDRPLRKVTAKSILVKSCFKL